MEPELEKLKLTELIAGGYEFTGRNFSINMGENKGKEFPIYAIKNDVAGLVYNKDKDKIEFCFKLPLPYTGNHAKMDAILADIKKTRSM